MRANSYGTTSDGGGPSGFGGADFEFAPPGGETVRFNFCNPRPSCGNGDVLAPGAALIRDRSGNLYGTTLVGGNTGCGGSGCGVVFKLSTAKKLSVLHAFNGSGGASRGTD